MNYKELADFGRGAVYKTLGVQNGADGGYLIPPELMLGIDNKLQEYSVFFKHGFVQDMKSLTLDLPSLKLNQTHADGESPLFGGMKLSWEGDNTAASDDEEPSFENLRLSCKTLIATFPVSNQMVDDGGEALGKYLECCFCRAIDWKTQYEFLRGNGMKKPVGIVTAPGTLVVPRENAGQLSQEDTAAMLEGLLPASELNAVWMCSSSARRRVATFDGYQVNRDAKYLHGRPLFVTEKLPRVGTQGDIVVFDPSVYAIGRRHVEISASRDVPTYFQQNQSVFRLIWRGDGAPLVPAPFESADGETVVSAFVALGDAEAE
jgi:HK97 family phage major capsid protein